MITCAVSNKTLKRKETTGGERDKIPYWHFFFPLLTLPRETEY